MTIIERVAALHGADPAEVKKEMEAAIQAVGLDLDLETFIRLCSERVQLQRFERSGTEVKRTVE